MCGRSNEVGRPAGRRSECRPGPRRRNAAKAAGDSPSVSRPWLPCLPPQAEFGRGSSSRTKDAECCASATRWLVKSEVSFGPVLAPEGGPLFVIDPAKASLISNEVSVLAEPVARNPSGPDPERSSAGPRRAPSVPSYCYRRANVSRCISRSAALNHVRLLR